MRRIVPLIASAALACALTQKIHSPNQSLEAIRVFEGGHQEAVLCLAFLPDSGRAISSGADDTARIWDVESGREVRRFSGPTFRFQSVALSPDGIFALSPTQGSTVRYWEVATGRDRFTFMDRAPATTVAMSADGSEGLSAGLSPAVNLWDLRRGVLLRRLEADLGAVIGVSLPGRRRVIAGGRQERVCRWDDATARCFDLSGDVLTALAFSADGRRIAAGSRFGAIHLWDVDRGRELLRFDGHAGEIVSLAFTPRADRLLSGGNDRTVRVWAVDTGREMGRATVSGRYVSAVTSARDGRHALAGSDDGTIRVWRLAR